MSSVSHARNPNTEISPVANIVNLVMIPLAFVLLILVFADIKGNLRLWLTVALFAFGPGSGITQLFRLPSAAMQLGVLVALSAAIDILMSQGLLQVHNISGDAAICLLTGITCIRPWRLRTNRLARPAQEIS